MKLPRAFIMPEDPRSVRRQIRPLRKRGIVLERYPDGSAHANIPHTYVVHSPGGFEWGYRGSGPADLALNVLALFVPPPEAWRLHQRFKDDIIASIPAGGPGTFRLEVPASLVRRWLRERWAEDRRAEKGG